MPAFAEPAAVRTASATRVFFMIIHCLLLFRVEFLLKEFLFLYSLG